MLHGDTLVTCLVTAAYWKLWTFHEYLHVVDNEYNETLPLSCPHSTLCVPSCEHLFMDGP